MTRRWGSFQLLFTIRPMQLKPRGVACGQVPCVLSWRQQNRKPAHFLAGRARATI
jgi:hypothetical protein